MGKLFSSRNFKRAAVMFLAVALVLSALQVSRHTQTAAAAEKDTVKSGNATVVVPGSFEFWKQVGQFYIDFDIDGLKDAAQAQYGDLKTAVKEELTKLAVFLVENRELKTKALEYLETAKENLPADAAEYVDFAAAVIAAVTYTALDNAYDELKDLVPGDLPFPDLPEQNVEALFEVLAQLLEAIGVDGAVVDGYELPEHDHTIYTVDYNGATAVVKIEDCDTHDITVNKIIAEGEGDYELSYTGIEVIAVNPNATVGFTGDDLNDILTGLAVKVNFAPSFSGDFAVSGKISLAFVVERTRYEFQH